MSGAGSDKGAAMRRAAMLKTAFGPVIGAALADETVSEIMANPDGALFIERLGVGRERQNASMQAGDVERIIRLVASHIGEICDRNHPIVSAELPGTGERFEGVLPPVSVAPAFSIRKPARRAMSIADWTLNGAMTRGQALILQSAIARRENILISGGTSSGKTTLANSLLAEIGRAGERIFILEDTRELHCDAEDVVSLRTAPGVGLETLVRSTMRLRPDRIIIGEVRGGEALDLLKAWNTGHPGGIATVHANSAEAALSRLEQLTAERAHEIPRALIGEAVNLIIHIGRRGSERRVEHILRVAGHDPLHGYALAPADPQQFSIVSEGARP
ncbi:MAG: P-type conjugative transfer ATPase TrbB [Parvularculaceae bacterium]